MLNASRNPIGFSTGFYYHLDLPIEERLEKFLALGNEAVEIHLQDPLQSGAINPHVIELTKQFKYRSIHLPTHIQYPSEEAEQLLPQILELARAIDANTLVMHPDTVVDADWVAQNFDDHIAFENMDVNKLFGTIPDDLVELFAKVPQAKWVFDINHAYTVDPTQTLARSLFHDLGYRIAHYHFSGFGGDSDLGRHITMMRAGQDEMFAMLVDQDIPIIVESVAQDDADTLAGEYQYITENLISS